MTELTWDGTCFACSSPLDIMIICDTGEIFNFVNNNTNLDIFSNNDMIYKIFDSKARKVCKACFDNYYEMKKYKNIRNIEYDKFPRLKNSMSHSDIKTWFDNLKKSWVNYNI